MQAFPCNNLTKMLYPSNCVKYVRSPKVCHCNALSRSGSPAPASLVLAHANADPDPVCVRDGRLLLAAANPGWQRDVYHDRSGDAATPSDLGRHRFIRGDCDCAPDFMALHPIPI